MQLCYSMYRTTVTYSYRQSKQPWDRPNQGPGWLCFETWSTHVAHHHAHVAQHPAHVTRLEIFPADFAFAVHVNRHHETVGSVSHHHVTVGSHHPPYHHVTVSNSFLPPCRHVTVETDDATVLGLLASDGTADHDHHVRQVICHVMNDGNVAHVRQVIYHVMNVAAVYHSRHVTSPHLPLLPHPTSDPGPCSTYPPPWRHPPHHVTRSTCGPLSPFSPKAPRR